MSLKRVNELFETIKKAKDELKEIRDNCQHPTYTIGVWSWRAGHFKLSRICDDCQIAIPGITSEEIEANKDKALWSTQTCSTPIKVDLDPDFSKTYKDHIFEED